MTPDEHTIPPWMPQPEAPPAASPYDHGAKIIDQRFDADGTVRVTWALPGFNTATVRMPYSSWVEGWAHTIAPTLVDLARGLGVDYENAEQPHQKR